MEIRRGVATVAQLATFDEIIDARTPAEFAEDRLPGAISLPTLDDAQRIAVGTAYKQRSAFEARRIGAAMAAENIARHLAGHFHDKPKNWRPLVYCWRGGMRSGALVTCLRMVGWDACQLEGGYKAFRNHVISELGQLPARLALRVLCGPTGSGKTRILEALAAQGAQTLDLEALAAHRGSVLGAMPERPQPSQKAFETLLHERLRQLDPARPVFIEAESRKIGRLQVPEPLLAAMRAAPCIVIDAGRNARCDFLLRDYAWIGDDITALQENLDRLQGLQSNETLARWREWANAGKLKPLLGELVDLHYDPLYRRSHGGNYRQFAAAPRLVADDLSPVAVEDLARRILTQG